MDPLDPIEGFRLDVQFVLLHAVLRLFREVRITDELVATPRGPRHMTFTARCPANKRHRLTIRQANESVLFDCPACMVSPSTQQRLGSALAKLTGLEVG